MSTAKEPNRWVVAIASVVMQIALGAVYAWSVFRTPLVHRLHATISQVSLTFTIAIFTLGCLTSPLDDLQIRIPHTAQGGKRTA